MNHFEIIADFKQALLDAGIIYLGDIIADGKLHRFHVEGDKAGSQNGAYVLHADQHSAGWFQDFKQGIEGTWRARGNSAQLTQADKAAIEQAKQQRQQEQQTRHEKAADKARYTWSVSTPAKTFPYLTKKNIQAHGARVTKNKLLATPLFNKQKELVNLQFISADGQKRFLSGGRKKGCFWWIGMPTQTIVIAEGFATAATLHEQTGHMVFIAYDAGNLHPVAATVKRLFPDSQLVIAVDHDLSGTGQEKAQAAALAVSAWVSMPPTPGHDWNDHYNSLEVK